MKKFGIHAAAGREYFKIMQLNHLNKVDFNTEKFSYYSIDHVKPAAVNCIEEFEDFCKKNKGVGICKEYRKLIVYSDPFCSVPVYVSRDEDKIVLTSDIEVFYRRKDIADRIGCYEILLFGSGLYDRTLIHGVKQLPAAAKCVIHLSDLRFEIMPYWNFEVKENKELKNLSAAVSMVSRRLLKIFEEIKPPVLMGISGGLDSRLSACMLSRTQKSEDLIFFTFGSDSKIQENTMAKKVIQKVWKNGKKPKHQFVRLSEEDYRLSKYVPVSTGAQIGLNHIHLYRCIKRLKENPKTFLSNYYSDAVMGWDTIPEKMKETMEECDYYKVLHSNCFGLSYDEQAAIELDLLNVCRRYPEQGNFSCMNEFVYVTERNPKFHVRLSAVLAEFVNVSLPYADYGLLKLMLSIPVYLRAEKLIEEKIIQQYMGDMYDISSRRYSERSRNSEKRYKFGEKLYYKYGYYKMRGINAFNAVMGKVTDYRVQAVNPYLTENQNVVLNQYLFDQFLDALSYLKEKGFVNQYLYDFLGRKEYRGHNTALKYNMIGLYECLLKLEEGSEIESSKCHSRSDNK